MNESSIVKQSGNDVEGCRSQKVLFQPNCNMLLFLQYSVKVTGYPLPSILKEEQFISIIFRSYL